MEKCAFEEDDEGNKESRATPTQAQCMILDKRGSARREFQFWKPPWWKPPATMKLEKQLNARWRSEELIGDQLDSFLDSYKCTATPMMLRDVSDILTPGRIPPHELATLTWFGDWRPSTILQFLQELNFLSLGEERLAQIINDVVIEEAIIDSQMAEIQSTCVFYFSFAHTAHSMTSESIIDEFRKIEKVIKKAQQLRCKVLQTAVKKVLTQTEAAEFLVAFAGVQNAIRQCASNLKLKDSASLPLPWEQFKHLS